MKKCFLITLIVILLGSLCSCSNPNNLYPTFSAQSDNWKLEIVLSQVTEADKQLYDLQNQNNLVKEELTLTYKGKDLDEVSKVYFVLTKDSAISKFDEKLFKGSYHCIGFYDDALMSKYKTLDITWNNINEKIKLKTHYKKE